MENKKIAFFFSYPDNDKPIGGYKVVYEYANRFACAGYEVQIIYTFSRLKFDNFFLFFRSLLGYFFKKRLHFFKLGSWFELNPKIKKRFVFNFSNKVAKSLKDFKVVSTYVTTAFELASANYIINDNKFYFIQGFEDWDVGSNYVFDSYRLPLKKIVIAPWLQKKVNEIGQDAYLIMNGFDFNYFHLEESIENRNRYEICMMYHTMELKRCCDTFQALEIVKARYPDIHVNVFSVFKKPSFLPDWYSYYELPGKEKHNEIYNKSSIYVAASEFDGFGLTIGEAMICGCAIVCTNNDGFLCMAKHMETAMVSNIKNVSQLANNIISLIEDNDLRIMIAKNGNTFIKNFSWDKSFIKFKNVIEGVE